MTDPREAAAGLEAARATRTKLAGKTRCPPYMHAVFGALLGSLIASEAASHRGTLIIEGAVIVIGLAIFFAQRRRLGFFINGYRRGRTRPVALAIVGLYLGLFSLAAYLKEADGLHWPAVMLGLIMFGTGTWASTLWQGRFRAEMEEAWEIA